jgi:hypothetical protein
MQDSSNPMEKLNTGAPERPPAPPAVPKLRPTAAPIFIDDNPSFTLGPSAAQAVQSAQQRNLG